MAQTFTKILLSGSDGGRNIAVSGSSSPGTLIHTAVSGSSGFDEIYIYAVNSSGSGIQITVQWGGTSSPADEVTQTIPSKAGLVPIIPGCVLNNGYVVRIYAVTPNVINIMGFVNRIT